MLIIVFVVGLKRKKALNFHQSITKKGSDIQKQYIHSFLTTNLQNMKFNNLKSKVVTDVTNHQYDILTIVQLEWRVDLATSAVPIQHLTFLPVALNNWQTYTLSAYI